MKNNRKTAAFVTALAMVITTAKISSGMTAIEAKDEIIYGDLNSDGKVDITDLSLLSLHLIGDKPLETDELKESADVQYDKTIDLGDLACLRQFLSKKTDTIGKITKPADSTETTGSADSSELKDITDQCTFLEIDDYWRECYIYGKFAKNYAEEYTTMISTKEDYDKYIGCFEKAVNAFEKAGITVTDDFFENNRIAIEMDMLEPNGMAMELTAVKTDSEGNVNLYFDRHNPGTLTMLAAYYYNIAIIPDNPHNDSKASSHYNTIDMF